MHKSDLIANPTPENRANKVFELRAGTIGTNRSINFLRIQFWNGFNILLQIINFTLVPYVKNNEMKLEFMTYYPLHVDPDELVFII